MASGLGLYSFTLLLEMPKFKKGHPAKDLLVKICKAHFNPLIVFHDSMSLFLEPKM